MTNLVSILKHCPKGTKLYSPIYGEVTLYSVNNRRIDVIATNYSNETTHIEFSHLGRLILGYSNAECVLFPSKDQRDWSKFEAPWYKKDKFDPTTLKAFDKVLVRDERIECWRCAFYSHQRKDSTSFRYATTANSYARCIPYNDDTKHLVGTTDVAPEYYRYWED